MPNRADTLRGRRGEIECTGIRPYGFMGSGRRAEGRRLARSDGEEAFDLEELGIEH